MSNYFLASISLGHRKLRKKIDLILHQASIRYSRKFNYCMTFATNVFSPQECHKLLQARGYVYLSGHGQNAFGELARSCGEILQTTEVTPRSSGRSLVCSSDSLGLHTDHYRVDYIAWHCVEQAGHGGETLLLDTRPLLDELPEKILRILTRVHRSEHKIFPGDVNSHPILVYRDNQPCVYFTYWQESADAETEQMEALRLFQEAVDRANPVAIKLRPGDTLIIDNKRMLHGRTKIFGEQRQLTRLWIKALPPKKGYTMQTQLVFPEPIAPERIQFLEAKGLAADIAALDLEMVKMKLRDPEEGKGWSEEQCEDAEIEYKRFLHLNRKYPDASIVPNTPIDTMWHYHILDTRAYVEHSQQLFGGYFHHYPYFGMRGEEDHERLLTSFEETKQLYLSEFGEPMVRDEQQKCWHDCESRCWHACSKHDRQM